MCLLNVLKARVRTEKLPSLDNSISKAMYGAAAWIGYYWLLPDIIGYLLYSFIIHELSGGKNVWNNGTFYDGTKI